MHRCAVRCCKMCFSFFRCSSPIWPETNHRSSWSSQFSLPSLGPWVLDPSFGSMPGELALELQDVHDEVLGSPVDRGMQLVQAQLVLQHVFLLIIDLRAEEVTWTVRIWVWEEKLKVFGWNVRKILKRKTNWRWLDQCEVKKYRNTRQQKSERQHTHTQTAYIIISANGELVSFNQSKSLLWIHSLQQSGFFNSRAYPKWHFH